MWVSRGLLLVTEQEGEQHPGPGSGWAPSERRDAEERKTHCLEEHLGSR